MAQCVQCGRQLPGLTLGKKICQWCKQHEAAQRGEDSPIQRVEVAPWQRSQSSSMLVTQAIFGINVAVFLGMVLSIGAAMLSNPPGQALIDWGANWGPLTASGQWWRLLTCVFLHGSLLHIAFNMWCLWDLGRLAESVYGHWTFAVVYLITGVGSSLASIWWNPVVLSVGASGAIFGIAGALIASFYLGEFSLPRSAMSGMLRSILMFVGYNLFFGAVIARTDNAAHVGGLVMGLILGALIAKVAPVGDDVPRRIAVLLVGVVLVAGSGMWLAHSSRVHKQIAAIRQHVRPDDAIKELLKSASQRPNYIPIHEALAQAYFDKQDYDDAVSELKRVIALDPHRETSYYNLGQIYMVQKHPAQAEEAFSQLLKINPTSADGYSGLGDSLSEQHRYREALDEYRRAANIDSLYPGVYFKMGEIETRLNILDDAIASLLKQREVADSEDNEKLLAGVYDSKGMRKEADIARQKAAEFQKQ